VYIISESARRGLHGKSQDKVGDEMLQRGMLYIIKIAQSMSLFGLNIIDRTLPTFSHNTSIDEMFICIQTAGGYYKADLADT
jgi:hypothetical protein